MNPYPVLAAVLILAAVATYGLILRRRNRRRIAMTLHVADAVAAANNHAALTAAELAQWRELHAELTDGCEQ